MATILCSARTGENVPAYCYECDEPLGHATKAEARADGWKHYFDMDWWFCEDCAPCCFCVYHADEECKCDCHSEIEEEDEPHTCHTCSTTLTAAEFEKGKMCCDKPMFHEDEEAIECALCEEFCRDEHFAGCCNDGVCPRKVERMCDSCAKWDEEDEVWRCGECAEAKAKERGEEYDCLAGNPRCACGLLLSEDDMGVWEADKIKEPTCESCLANSPQCVALDCKGPVIHTVGNWCESCITQPDPAGVRIQHGSYVYQKQ